MDWFQFIAGMTASLAWPIAAISIVCIFRKGITDRIPDLAKLTLPGGISAEFGLGLDRLEAAFANEPVLLPNGRADNPEEPRHDDEPAGGPDAEPVAPDGRNAGYAIRRDAQDAFTLEVREGISEYGVDSIALRAQPTGVVMESWKLLESSIRSLASKRNPAASASALPVRHLIGTLVNERLIDVSDAENLKQMHSLRNLAAHSSKQIDEGEAERFKKLAEVLALKFDLMGNLI